ncbi:MAG: hypothetical protein WBC54_15995, partial [Rhodococcus sp. (in: high G+C Gram-positive bacteria)]
WSEKDWTLGSLPLSSAGRDWDAAIDAVARLSGMLHVLPPVRGSAVYGSRPGDPGRDRSDPGRPLVQEAHTQQARMSQNPQPRVAEPRIQAIRSPEPRVAEPRAAAPETPESRVRPPRVAEPRTQEPRTQEPRTQDPRPQEPGRRPRPPRPDAAGPQAARSANPSRPVPRPPASRPIPFDSDRRRNQP